MLLFIMVPFTKPSPLQLDSYVIVINELRYLLDNIDLEELFLILLTRTFNRFYQEVQRLFPYVNCHVVYESDVVTEELAAKLD